MKLIRFKEDNVNFILRLTQDVTNFVVLGNRDARII
jgi:hypothetical protein